MDKPQDLHRTLSTVEFVDRIRKARSRIVRCSVDVWGVGNADLRCAAFQFNDVELSPCTITFLFDRQASLRVYEPADCRFLLDQLTIGMASDVSWKMQGIGGIQHFDFHLKQTDIKFSMSPRVHVHPFPKITDPAVRMRWAAA